MFFAIGQDEAKAICKGGAGPALTYTGRIYISCIEGRGCPSFLFNTYFYREVLMSTEEILEKVATEVSTCTKCDLCKGRTKAVPGEGNPHAKIMFIGEGPGFHEDSQGRPFVGPAGQFLVELLASINLKRTDVFITNVVKCRPPGNRDPLPAEINACNDYLERQIAALDPEVIVTLGRFSMAKFFGGEKISSIHGRARKVDGQDLYCNVSSRSWSPSTKSQRYHSF